MISENSGFIRSFLLDVGGRSLMARGRFCERLVFVTPDLQANLPLRGSWHSALDDIHKGLVNGDGITTLADKRLRPLILSAIATNAMGDFWKNLVLQKFRQPLLKSVP